MRKLLFFSYLIAVVLTSVAQNSGFYYSFGTAKYWAEDSTSLNLIVTDTNDLIGFCILLNDLFEGDAEISYSDEDDNIIVTCGKLPNYEIEDIINFITDEQPERIKFCSYSKILDGDRIWFRNEVVAKVENTNISSAISLINTYEDVSITVEDSFYLYISCSDESTLLSLAVELFESDLVVFAEPDYYVKYDTYFNDPLYNKQYYLHNTGQSIPLFNNSTFQCVSGFDLKVPEAWSFITCLSNLSSTKVAIIDDGVENHEDLMINGQSKVLNGFPTSNHGRPKSVHEHGQCCAGIIAATPNNGKGIVGIDEKAKIVPIRIQKLSNIINGNPQTVYMSNGRIARGIRHAWSKYNADVLNNSWGHLKNKSQQITDAFVSAITNGRGNKGCIVVAASGNDFRNDTINFIGRIPQTISVGAIQGDGLRGPYSNYSSDLNVVAFGGYAIFDFSGNAHSDICTIDREGEKGYNKNNNGNYYEYFGMTSAAAPMVSGVASLMLSVNPDLTGSQVRDIIEQTAQKLPDYTFSPASTAHPNGSWNEQVGYGLVDAHKAVVHAYMFGHYISISGEQNPVIFQQYSYSCNMYHPELFTYAWSSVNGRVSFMTSNSTNATIVPNSAGEDSIIVSVYNQNRLMFRVAKQIVISDPCSMVNMNPVGITDFYVVNDTTWYENNRLLLSNVTIDSNVTLTITGALYCTDSARIIVRPGGKLVVDGGTLTTACDAEMWPGITVLGHSGQRQIAQNQGSVELRNGAVIEHARCGITLGADEDDLLHTGGILSATDASFRNCARAVHFRPYMDSTAGVCCRANTSSCTRVTFVVDSGNRFAQHDVTFNEHILLQDVVNVTFKACTLRNVGFVGNMHNCGIRALNASFGLTDDDDGSYPPNPNTVVHRSLLSGFRYGVYASGRVFGMGPCLINTVFRNNINGAYLQNTETIIIKRSSFHLDSLPYVFVKPSVNGVYLSNCSDAKFEGDTFTCAFFSFNPSSRGIHSNNNSMGDVIAYHNLFENLNYGIYASGNNGDSTRGLLFSCNEFLYNNYGIYIPASSTVAMRQKYRGFSADNSFTGITNYGIYNAGPQNINYYNSTVGLDPSLIYGSVTQHYGATSGGCFFSWDTIGTIVDPEPIKTEGDSTADTPDMDPPKSLSLGASTAGTGLDDVRIYPNPNNGQFTMNNEQLIMNSVQVYDVYGKLLKTVEVNANTVELDVRELASGMYFVRISTDKGVVTKSFVKK